MENPASSLGIVEDEIVVESASEVSRRLEKGSHDFVVQNYSLKKGIGVNKKIESEQFVVGGYSWSIFFYPDGITDEAYNQGYVSLYVSFNCSTSTHVNSIYVHILDQSGQGNHKCVSLIQSAIPATRIVAGSVTGYPKFINRSSLESPDYLLDDCLTIRCTIQVFACHSHILPAIQIPKSNMAAHFGKLLETKLGADVLFKVESEEFWAHKSILAASSPVFRSYLFDCHQSDQVIIPEMESRTFKAMLWCIYTGSLPEDEQKDLSDSDECILESFMGKLLAAADRFGLKRLKQLCESYIVESLSEKSAAYVLYLAEVYHAKELKIACLRFVAKNKDAVMGSDGCEYLRRFCPSLFLELAGYGESCSSGTGRKDLDFCRKILFATRESFPGLFWPWDASDEKHKLKEA